MVINGEDNPVVSGAATPLNMGEGEPGFRRLGPILGVDRLREEFLFGIPLTSVLTHQTLTDTALAGMIRRAIGDFETSCHIPITPVTIQDRFDFERADDLGFGTRQLTRYPVVKILNLKALWPGRNDILAGIDPNGSQEVDYPTSWVTLQGDQGLIRIIPNSGSIVNADASFLSSSAYRTIVLGGLKSWPNMWRITYIAGFENDKVPDIVNDLLGTIAAIKVLSMVGPTIFPFASQSIGLDGMSQSTATAGPAWLAQRIQELMAERDRIVAQIKAYYGTDVMFSAW